ncbi:AbiH family protein [Arachidicoccus terrestris]|uniref:AbiH family protein n=1 Tax=Arachidicoccus terrestris TaxID=2875539 RepID=UPI001CC388AC|nr:AbiH family protein [Arachidicoccus terrestris]UAY55697.1 bacteriophage abortive infection AbiH family protein [Arachidicoccus terrestris]
MNRLLLIGNGFDLAHRLKTRYDDFILWYLEKSFERCLKHGEYKDELLWIQKTQHATMLLYSIANPIAEFVDKLIHTNGFTSLMHTETMEFDSNPFIVKYRSEFLDGLMTKSLSSTWVEIENEYYEKLKVNLFAESETKAQELKALNDAFSFIREQLEDYLKTIQPVMLQPAFYDILASPININELLKTDLDQNKPPKEAMVLNFNYTDTIEQYLQNKAIAKNISVNYIHGKLGDPDNPIIFGFGDELDADYAKMELEKNNGYFEHIKSFGYFKTSNYYNLIRFLDADEYQVFILGHSCGLSDRTMLNMIFEHENCKSIKIYYYQENKQKNNYTELTQEISRHFRDKAMMRRKIVSIDKSSPMPQIK